MMATDIVERLEIRRSKKKIAIFLTINGFFSAVGFWTVLYGRGPHDYWAFGVLLLLFFMPGTLIYLRQWMRAPRPELVLTNRGLSYSARLRDPISWGDVQRVYLSLRGRSPFFHLFFYPEPARRLHRKGVIAWFRRLIGRRGKEFVFPLQMLDVDPRWLAAYAAAQVDAAKAARPPDPELDAIDAALAEPESAIGARYFAMALSVVLAVLFACELIFKAAPAIDAATPSIVTLFAFGGVSFGAVHEGQWWRLFTAPLLHAGLFHLLGNAVALLIVGSQLERLIGSAWFAGLFAASALAGSLASITFNAPNIVSVGASGGIIGLFAASAVASRHFPPGPMRNRLSSLALQILALSLLQFLLRSQRDLRIDYAAHFGGAVGGAILGLVLLRLWSRDRPRPEGTKFPTAIAAGFFLVAIASGAPIVRGFERAAWLAPDFPVNWEQAKLKSSEALIRYPRDPRVRLARAGLLADQGLDGLAEQELRAALDDTEALNVFGLDHMEARIRLTLASVVSSDRRRRDEARTILLPICRSQLPDNLRGLRASLAVCP